jgi:hypothetical protein
MHEMERISLYKVLVAKPEGKRTLGRYKHGWWYDIEMDIKEIRGGAWTGLIRLRIGSNGWFL